MEGEHLVLETGEEVSTITFTSPSNPVTLDMLEELEKAIREAEGGLVLAGNENFSTGFKLEELAEGDRNDYFQLSEKGQEVCNLLDSYPSVTVAATTGYTLGPGLELALACDFRVGKDTAVYGFPEVKLGLLPAFGAMSRLPELIGHGPSKRLLMTGNVIHAEEAQWMGLLDSVTSSPAEKAEGMARSDVHPEAKRLLSSTLAEQREAFAACCTEKTKEQIKDYIEKRAEK